nr:hypothetical protein [Morchella crassipes]
MVGSPRKGVGGLGGGGVAVGLGNKRKRGLAPRPEGEGWCDPVLAPSLLLYLSSKEKEGGVHVVFSAPLSLASHPPPSPQPIFSLNSGKRGSVGGGGCRRLSHLCPPDLYAFPHLLNPLLSHRRGGGHFNHKMTTPPPPSVLFNFHYIISLYNESKFSDLTKTCFALNEAKLR